MSDKALVAVLEKLDPFLQFLTKATSKTSVPVHLLEKVVPASESDGGSGNFQEALLELTYRGILNYQQDKKEVGFPPPPSSNLEGSSSRSPLLCAPPKKLIGKGLSGASDAAAKRRLKVLKWTFEQIPSWICQRKTSAETPKKKRKAVKSIADTPTPLKRQVEDNRRAPDDREDECSERRDAYKALDALLRGHSSPSKRAGAGETEEEKEDDRQWLPCQAAYSATHPSREARYGKLTPETIEHIPKEVLDIFDLDVSDCGHASILGSRRRRLFSHQARAIESAMAGAHTVVTTSTGSGKSLCYLLPVLAKTLKSLKESSPTAAILMFPTKALAQDQFTKIDALLQSLSHNKGSDSPLRAGVIDGDTPHCQRDDIANSCQIILTNPDTIHAAILPNWKKKRAYKDLLGRLTTIIIDEAHIYMGAFGAHVSIVLARLHRICRVASSPSNSPFERPKTLQYIATSATMANPEKVARLLCPIGEDESVCVLTAEDDGSPCSAKFFFVWNPPIVDINGNSTQSLFAPKNIEATSPRVKTDGAAIEAKEVVESANDVESRASTVVNIPIGRRKRQKKNCPAIPSRRHPHVHSEAFVRRRHAADETAFLFAKAIAAQTRCIVFCKTRMLVEWVYEATLKILSGSPKTSHLTAKVESYRGGYMAEARRSIEQRLFQRKLLGVVGTCALELGVDVGGVDLTLHTGYPGSISALLQQAGRAGRGGKNVFETSRPSASIMIAFSSPSEQHIWKHPKTLVSRGVNAEPSLPINATVSQGHLLCAGEEFPLTGSRPVSCLLNEVDSPEMKFPADADLLGPGDVYDESVAFLQAQRLLSPKMEKHQLSRKKDKLVVHTTHPVVKNPWARVSLRTIEPLSYLIVDKSHPLQANRTDKLHDPRAVLDTIPYSRVFYHAFPGAVIMHRGRKYRIESMESPPMFVGGSNWGSSCNLLAFATPTAVTYSTQALSVNQITVVKQFEHAELTEECKPEMATEKHEREPAGCEEEKHRIARETETAGAVCGRGTVTCKRSVHGFKKLSHVNRKELSRGSIVLPPLEFDTMGLWIDTDASVLRELVHDFDSGVHAISHAMVAVAPLFVSCTTSDIDCDHSRYENTRVLLYDQRPGASGVTRQLYSHIIPLFENALELLAECASCSYKAVGYDGGCPACLQSVPCDNFHQDLSRRAGVQVGKHLLRRLKKSNLRSASRIQPNELNTVIKPRNILIGRASWEKNEKEDRSRFADVD